MATRVGVNGFGRMGRLALRAAWSNPDLEFVHINEIAGDVAMAAHLLQFDSVRGTWDRNVVADGDDMLIDGNKVSYSSNREIDATSWSDLGVDLVLECTGKFKTREALERYLAAGVGKVVVSAPVKQDALNIVVGVNHDLYQPDVHDVVTAASCTTNCIAPVVSVIHEVFGIERGTITTIHDVTNTQSVLDQFHSDPRRARASSMNLIPTSTGSATAITDIFPQLRGKLSGIAVRVPLANASITDCVFQVAVDTDPAAVNEALQAAAAGRLRGVLGVEERPLVSTDYRGDTRSAIVDAQATMVTDSRLIKLLVWYDNEIGYVHRLTELAALVGRSLP